MLKLLEYEDLPFGVPLLVSIAGSGLDSLKGLLWGIFRLVDAHP